MSDLKIGIVTKEWPPFIYGGAGVHVHQLTQALRSIEAISVDVHCFDGLRDDAFGYSTPEQFRESNPAITALVTDLEIASHLQDLHIVHSHTWYTNMAGHFAWMQHRIPHVITAHSLEPLRPWKAEQLGGGYEISSWAEKTAFESAAAIIAVSDAMREDVLDAYPNVNPDDVVVIRNGVDSSQFIPNHDPSVAIAYGVSAPYAIFVGRITRQKGLAHLLRAWADVPAQYGLVIAAGNADEDGVATEVADLIAELQRIRGNIWWISEKLARSELTALLTGAELFICPSIYEPLGIVNLEAMACETAVLASRVGGIPEVVLEGQTGELVDYDADSHIFEEALAIAITRLISQPDLLKAYGRAGRLRAQEEFSWESVAHRTIELYRKVLA